MRQRLVSVLLLCGLAAFSACGGGDDGGSGSGSEPESGGGTVTLDDVEAAIEAELDTEVCPFGLFEPNSTGVDEEEFPGVTEFMQWDCYESQEDQEAGVIPQGLQELLFAQFDDEATAEAYAQDQAEFYPVLLVGDTVVVGSNVTYTSPSMDAEAVLEQVNQGCDECGDLILPEE